MNITLEVWRQQAQKEPGRFVTYTVSDATPKMSLLELLDRLNADLVDRGVEPIAFEHDCREGICGCCGVLVDGVAHGPTLNTPTCQQHLRSFTDGATLRLAPMGAAAYPVIRDLMIDRSALDRIIAAGGFVSTPTGSAPEANSIPIAKDIADRAMDDAACIGCGACVAACPNASAQLFLGAKVAQLALLPQGQPERGSRALAMSAAAAVDFGACSDVGACRDACPAGISLDVIASLNRDVLRASWSRRRR